MSDTVALDHHQSIQRLLAETGMGGTAVLVMAEMAAAIAERGPNTTPGTVRLVAVGGGIVTGVTE